MGLPCCEDSKPTLPSRCSSISSAMILISYLSNRGTGSQPQTRHCDRRGELLSPVRLAKRRPITRADRLRGLRSVLKGLADRDAGAFARGHPSKSASVSEAIGQKGNPPEIDTEGT